MNPALTTMTDRELIDLWHQITSHLDEEDTQKPSLGTRQFTILGHIHDELIKRGYRVDDSSWLKGEEAESP